MVTSRERKHAKKVYERSVAIRANWNLHMACLTENIDRVPRDQANRLVDLGITKIQFIL